MDSGLARFRDRFNEAARKAGRDGNSLKLLAVTKGQAPEKLAAFFEQGLPFWGLGESYLEELLLKREVFSQSQKPWHFIGRLQSRKIPSLLESCEVLHTVSREKELELIAKRPREFFIQVNVSDESSKNGIHPKDLAALIRACELPGLRAKCLGLMCLPSPLEDVGEARLRQEFGTLRKLRDDFFPAGLLNMGTSADFEIAISEGADVVRVGSLLFGERSA